MNSTNVLQKDRIPIQLDYQENKFKQVGMITCAGLRLQPASGAMADQPDIITLPEIKPMTKILASVADKGAVRTGAGLRAPKASVADKGTVRTGAGLRAPKASVADKGTVRTGAGLRAPKASVADKGTVRTGAGLRAPKASVADKGTVRTGAGLRRPA
ncbi:hypothetical protein [Roseomonas sp. HF4]|uniref:hypothetical protein n=1 Tax=Roseomonas sp. HF4 TaxID=2562313 RepID=UPI0010C03FD9|nr:hypothetical protein [Roseomonas sp. HF4]